MDYYAHSENDKGKKHPLSEHLRQTAKLTERFACRKRYKHIFRITGLLHDLGKYQHSFQNYLINGGRRGSVPHASWGSAYAKIHRLIESSFAIDGHHKGLPDRAVWKSDAAPYIHGDVAEFENVVETFFQDTQINEESINSSPKMEFDELLQHEFFIRYLFSSLTDSDWLSTEKHFDNVNSSFRGCSFLPIEAMIIKLENELSGKSKNGPINRLRNKARMEAMGKAGMPSAFYSLSLPTGLGKTLTSLSWALEHAKQNALNRIIIVLPYINIIDQTAQILKDLFGDELVLEHHSSYNETNEDDEKLSEIQKRKRLACENWDYPIIVTTTVQFFESIFSNKPSKCRKIHNIAEAVVIFDEVQTLPKNIILPTLQMLKDLQVVMKTSFLFCTATQPAFGKRENFSGIDHIQPLIENSAELYNATKRVEYHLLNDLEPIDCTSLSQHVAQHNDSTLVIFNTKKAALELYDCIQNVGTWETIYHLSTSMCPAHRKKVIADIKEDLIAEKRILVISTQLIEAGVDFDFPLLFRAMAPLEGIIQAAGRCNREGDLGQGNGHVYLFNLEYGGMPDKTYGACAGFAEELIKTDINQLYRHDVFEQYYANVVDLYVDPDKYAINRQRKNFNFKVVAESYRIIEKATQGLFIYDYSEESRQLFHDIQYKEFLSKNDFRKMQVFTVQVYNNFIFKNSEQIETMPQGFLVWHGNYDKNIGVSLTVKNPEKFIV